MSYYLGPTNERWTPSTWQDVCDAAANGLLDEQQWIELKEAVPTGAGANLELARDLAALAAEGGLLVIGVRDDGSKAGEVVGTSLAGLADRVDQVSRDRIHPPLVVRPSEIADPGREGYGCLLVVVDASPEAPHMVDGRYWGRGATGKRILGDTDVRRLLDQNGRRREDFLEAVRRQIETGPLSEPGCLHLLLVPRAGRSGALEDLVNAPNELSNLISSTARPDPSGWRLDHLLQSRRRVRGLELSNVDLGSPRVADYADADFNFIALSLRDDGQVGLTVTGIVGEQTVYGEPTRLVSTTGVVALTQQLLSVAGRLADLAAYGGAWDIGLAITNVGNTRPWRTDGFGRSRFYGAVYPDPEYVGTTTTTSRELVDGPNVILDRLARPFLRVLGDERQLDISQPPS